MDATQLKVISFFVIFILGAIFTLLPFLLIKRKFNAEELILSLGNALAGGKF
jgi:VIT1/CCC1 family predicted Fe2+/Mn2+ transporter